MVKRTLYFGNPAYLSVTNEQLVINLPDSGQSKSCPVESLGLVILDHGRITVTHQLISCLLENNVALVTCDGTHHPTGLLMCLDGNSLQSQKFRHQIAATEPLKKQLWRQTVVAKIQNQASLLRLRGSESKSITHLVKQVKSGDSTNVEAKAAVVYWKSLFPRHSGFRRDRYGDPPNNLLNYGYAILRALVARSLVGSGLLPTLGIHHRNQYNAYCLADDIMEPYRPFVDRLVCDIMDSGKDGTSITTGIKQTLLSIPVIDVELEGVKSPLMVSVQRTTATLARCFENNARKLVFPTLVTKTKG